MVPISIQAVNIDAFTLQFSGLARAVGDLTSVWPYASQALEAITAAQFDSEGSRGAHGEWAPLTPEYEKEKRKRWGDKPILEASGRLKTSFEDGGGEHVDEATPTDLTWGSETPYAIYHQTGYAKAFGGGRRRATVGHELERQFAGTRKSARESADVFGAAADEGFGGEVAMALTGQSTTREVPARRELDFTPQDYRTIEQGVHRGVINLIRRTGAAVAREAFGPGELSEMSGGEFFVIGKQSLAGGL